MDIFNVNGAILGAEALAFPASSRGYRYGDGFFESMRYSNSMILHNNLHWDRIQKSAMLLKMVLPEWLQSESLQARIKETADAANIVNARVRCTFFRESNGLYTPINSDVSIVIEITKMDAPEYEWNERGLHLGSFKELNKNSNYTSVIKSNSAILNVMAGIYARENGYDECVIYNEMGRVAECISSNIFTFNGAFLNTPGLSEFCVDGVMRKVVIQLAQEYGYTLLEQPVSEITISSADEVFLTSATRGIRWVENFNGKQYKNDASKVLFERLNKGFIR